MNYRYTPKVSSNFSSTNNRFGAIAAVDETQGDGDFVPRPCENSKYRRFKGYLDRYLMADRGLQRILCGRLLKTRFRTTFSHSLCPLLQLTSCLPEKYERSEMLSGGAIC